MSDVNWAVVIGNGVTADDGESKYDANGDRITYPHEKKDMSEYTADSQGG